jgi:hypothetical protein
VIDQDQGTVIRSKKRAEARLCIRLILHLHVCDFIELEKCVTSDSR